LEIGSAISKEIKMIGEWTDLGGERGFMLFETEDPKAMIETTM